MGSPKQHAMDGGCTLGDRMLTLADACCADVVVSGPPGAIPGRQHIEDLAPHAGWGPLAGIEAMLADGRANRWLVLPCDMPALTISDVRRLIDAEGPVCCFGRPEQPAKPLQLPVTITVAMLPSIRAHLESDRRALGGWLSTIDVTIVDAPPAPRLRNANRPEDLAEPR
jgi:molybdopterin-guanine dinucleotide biosynthesis protein A